MWTIRFLSGSLMGESISLKNHQIIGRDDHCDIVIKDTGISKKHAEIKIENGKVYLIDLNSSNGTFVNGIKIQKHKLKEGDKIAFFQVIAEIGQKQKKLMIVSSQKSMRSLEVKNNHLQSFQSPPQELSSFETHSPTLSSENKSLEDSDPKLQPLRHKKTPDQIVDSAMDFIDKKVVSEVVSLTKKISFKNLFFIIAIIFVLTVTILSVIPMYLVTEDSIKNESFLRALSVARSVAQINENKLKSGEMEKFSTDLLYYERGIEDIYVINKDGVILAPLEISGTMPKHVQFARDIRGKPKEFVTQSGSLILAAVPIMAFDHEQQINVAKAHVVVSYKSDVFKFREERVFSLFIQVLLIGFVVGSLLFFILYKVIEYSLRKLYDKIDEAIKSGADQVYLDFNFPIIQDLLTIINSLLSRATMAENQKENDVSTIDRLKEYINLCSLIPFPGLIVNKDRLIEFVNSSFTQMIDINLNFSQKIHINQIPHQALQQNFNYLIDQSFIKKNEIVTDHLEISGNNFKISCQSLHVIENDPDHFLLVISPEGSS